MQTQDHESLAPHEAIAELAVRRARESFEAYARMMFPTLEGKALLTPLWWLECCALFERIAKGEAPRVTLSVAPQHGKSTLAALLVSWIIGRDPSTRIVLASYASQLAETRSRSIQRAMRSDVYKLIFPEAEISADHHGVGYWSTSKGGSVVAVGVGSGLSGMEGSGLIACDDLIADRQAAESKTVTAACMDWWKSTLVTRAGPNTPILLIGTRWSEADPIGQLQAGPSADEWQFVTYPAVDEDGNSTFPERFPTDVLNKRRIEVGEAEWTSLYLQQPRPKGGNYCDPDLIPVIDEEPQGLRWHRFIDLAATAKARSDFTASIKAAYDPRSRTLFVASPWAMKLQWPQARARICTVADMEPGVPIVVELSGQFQVAVDNLREVLNGKRVVKTITCKGDKLSRALGWIALAEAQRLVFIKKESEDQHWREMYHQILGFPSEGVGIHDDLVDCLSHAQNHLVSAQRSSAICFDDRYRAMKPSNHIYV